jgi:NADPH:quinone reductase-like Zn-dependent oxidoreductase
MKAITKYRYGGPEVLQMEEVDKPSVQEGQLLVKVHANSANPADWHIMRGAPFFARFSFGLTKPNTPILGADFAGVVEEVGANVTDFKVGDRVFGESLKGGAFAEYTSVAAKACGIMPDNASFEQMACVPIAGITALQELVNHGKLQKGDSVLINGSTGGVGHFAVQIAKAYGATVTAVCSSKSADFAKQLGADNVIAYDQQDLGAYGKKHDLVIDNHGNLTLADFKRLGHRGVVVGFTTMSNMMGLLLKSGFSKYALAQFTAEANTADLNTLASLIEEGKIQPYIEKSFPAEQIPEAIGYIEAMRTKGKVSMVWE